MKRKISLTLILSLVLTIFTTNFNFAASEDGTALLQEKTLASLHFDGTEDYSAGQEVIKALNEKRKVYGLEPLQLREDLTDAAMTRAVETCVRWSSIRPRGGANTTVLEGLNKGAFAEVIDNGLLTDGACKVLVNKSREPLQNPEIKSVGIGCFYDADGFTHWLLLFDDEVGKNETRTEKKSVRKEVKVSKDMPNAFIVPDTIRHEYTYKGVYSDSPDDIRMFAVTADKLGNKWYTPIDIHDFNLSTTDNSTAVVDENGKITILNAGSFKIKAQLKENNAFYGFSSSIKVEKGITEVMAYREFLNLTVGKAFPIKFSTDSDGKVTYSSMNPSLASVSDDGIVTFHSEGETDIVIKIDECRNFLEHEFRVTVGTQIPTKIIKLDTQLTKVIGSEPFRLKLKMYENERLEYVSSNSKVATVSETGTVRLQGIGNAKIKITKYTVSGLELYSRTIDLAVIEKEQTLIASDQTITCGAKSFSLDAKSLVGSKLSYVSSKPKVAKVSADGKVTPVSPGKTTIRVTASATEECEEVSKSITITVKPKRIVTNALVASGKGKLRIAWKKDPLVDGYQIAYARNKTFTSNKHIVTVPDKYASGKLIFNLSKGKTYYFKVRSYKKNGSQKIYGSWSAYKYKKCR